MQAKGENQNRMRKTQGTKEWGQDRGCEFLRDFVLREEVDRQRSCLRVISSEETRVSHSSTSPDGPRCHQVGRLVGEGLVGCSTIVHKTSFQKSVLFPHHHVGNCLLNVHFFMKMQVIAETSKDNASNGFRLDITQISRAARRNNKKLQRSSDIQSIFSCRNDARQAHSGQSRA